MTTIFTSSFCGWRGHQPQQTAVAGVLAGHFYNRTIYKSPIKIKKIKLAIYPSTFLIFAA